MFEAVKPPMFSAEHRHIFPAPRSEACCTSILLLSWSSHACHTGVPWGAGTGHQISGRFPRHPMVKWRMVELYEFS